MKLNNGARMVPTLDVEGTIVSGDGFNATASSGTCGTPARAEVQSGDVDELNRKRGTDVEFSYVPVLRFNSIYVPVSRKSSTSRLKASAFSANRR